MRKRSDRFVDKERVEHVYSTQRAIKWTLDIGSAAASDSETSRFGSQDSSNYKKYAN